MWLWGEFCSVMTIQVYDDIFDKLFLLELSSWLIEECTYIPNNVANRTTHPYGFEGSHRFMSCVLYANYEGTAEKHWEYVYRTNHRIKLGQLFGIYEDFQQYSKNKCMLQGIDINLQFKEMNGTYHTDGTENQTVCIMMLAYHDIEENMGGEFYHKPTGEKIPFRQGRVMEMTASDSHRADAFNVPYIPRFSIKFTGLNNEISQIYNGKNISF